MTDVTVEQCDWDVVGSVTWHCSEEDSGPDVGISVSLGSGRELWVGELLKSDGADVGLAVYGPGASKQVAALGDFHAIRELVEDHLAPALTATFQTLAAAPPQPDHTALLREAQSALLLVAGRLQWASKANPGCRDEKGRDLVADWAAEAHAAYAALSETGA